MAEARSGTTKRWRSGPMAVYFLGMRALGLVGGLAMTFVALTVLADESRSDRLVGLFVIALFGGAFAVATRVLGRNYLELHADDDLVVAVQGGVAQRLPLSEVTFFVPVTPSPSNPPPAYCKHKGENPVGCGLLTQGMFRSSRSLGSLRVRLAALDVRVVEY